MKFKRYSVCVDSETAKAIQSRVERTGESTAEVTRDLIKRGLASEWIDKNTDLISTIVRHQMDIAIKPHIERLAKLSSKGGHMSATAAFLNVQALMDLVPKENRKNVTEMYEKARVKAVGYMRMNIDD